MTIRLLTILTTFFLSPCLYASDMGICKSCYEDETQVFLEVATEFVQIHEEQVKADNETLCDFTVQGMEGQYPNRKNNCLKLIRKSEALGLSREALEYTLKTFKMNFGSLKDRSCIKVKSTPEGIKNPCQILINDMNSRIEGRPNRSNSYYIDLCANENKPVISKSYVNRGVGSAKNSYKDINDKNTTVIGAFLTGSKLTKFIPNKSKKTGKISTKYTNKGWKWNDNRCSDEQILADGDKTNCPFVRLELYGVQDSNNTSVYANKPMHTSPLFSSWGCPSLGMDDNWKMAQLAMNGPSLIMNWGPDKYHTEDSLTNCKNDN